jgi:anti-anti-sigma factor
MIDIDTRMLTGGVLRVSVAGEIDLNALPKLDGALASAVGREDITGVEVSFAGVSFCDSAGFASLDRAYGVARERSLTFRLIEAQPCVRRLLALLGLLEGLTGEKA